MSFEMQHQPNMSLQTQDEKQMGMFLHLSQLINLFFPPIGLIVPIVLWQIKKGEMPALDAHGKMVTNWILSSLIYGLICGVLIAFGFPLMLVVVGFFLVIIGGLGLSAIGIAGAVFAIIGGIKANNGELWEYPLTIKFLK
ncbi:MAG: DUF4870 domain-containing protein [Pyrinomonadaceae bacterium]